MDKAFSIDTELNITLHDTRAEAAKALEGSEGGAVFSTLKQLQGVFKDASLSALVGVFNTFTGVTPVKKFNSRDIGIKRIWAQCERMLGVEVPEAEEPAAAPARAPKAAKEAKPRKERKTKAEPAADQDAKGPREGSKTAQVIELLKRPEGVSLDELVKKFGWQTRTIRAMVCSTGAINKKHGHTVLSEKNEKGDRIFRIAS